MPFGFNLFGGLFNIDRPSMETEAAADAAQQNRETFGRQPPPEQAQATAEVTLTLDMLQRTAEQWTETGHRVYPLPITYGRNNPYEFFNLPIPPIPPTTRRQETNIIESVEQLAQVWSQEALEISQIVVSERTYQMLRTKFQHQMTTYRYACLWNGDDVPELQQELIISTSMGPIKIVADTAKMAFNLDKYMETVE